MYQRAAVALEPHNERQSGNFTQCRVATTLARKLCADASEWAWQVRDADFVYKKQRKCCAELSKFTVMRSVRFSDI